MLRPLVSYFVGFLSMTLLSGAMAVQAQDDVSQEKTGGITFGANVGYAAFSPLGKSSPEYGGSYVTSVYVGYDFVHFFGLELGYGISGKFKPQDDANVEIESQIARFGPSMSGDLTDWLGIYNKIQYANVRYKVTEGNESSLDTNGAYYEVGLQWRFTDNIGLTTSASYLWTTGDDNTFSQIQGLGGLHFRF